MRATTVKQHPRKGTRYGVKKHQRKLPENFLGANISASEYERKIKERFIKPSEFNAKWKSLVNWKKTSENGFGVRFTRSELDIFGERTSLDLANEVYIGSPAYVGTKHWVDITEDAKKLSRKTFNNKKDALDYAYKYMKNRWKI